MSHQRSDAYPAIVADSFAVAVEQGLIKDVHIARRITRGTDVNKLSFVDSSIGDSDQGVWVQLRTTHEQHIRKKQDAN